MCYFSSLGQEYVQRGFDHLEIFIFLNPFVSKKNRVTELHKAFYFMSFPCFPLNAFLLLLRVCYSGIPDSVPARVQGNPLSLNAS